MRIRRRAWPGSGQPIESDSAAASGVDCRGRRGESAYISRSPLRIRHLSAHALRTGPCSPFSSNLLIEPRSKRKILYFPQILFQYHISNGSLWDGGPGDKNMLYYLLRGRNWQVPKEVIHEYGTGTLCLSTTGYIYSVMFQGFFTLYYLVKNVPPSKVFFRFCKEPDLFCIYPKTAPKPL